MFADLALLLHPLPARPGPGADEFELDVWSDQAHEADRRRRDCAEELRQSWEVAEDYDPLIAN